MTSRTSILAALRRNAPSATPAPDLAGLGVTFDDPLAQLERATVLAGGTFVRVSDLAAAAAALEARLAQLSGAQGSLDAAARLPQGSPGPADAEARLARRSSAPGSPDAAARLPQGSSGPADAEARLARRPSAPESPDAAARLPQGSSASGSAGDLAQLEAAPTSRAPRQTVSLVPGVGATSLDLAAITDPRALAELHLVVLPGAFAVAENAAVWVDTQALPHRALFVIPDHLALVVPTAAVVHHMHDAYARLAGRAPGHGVFLSGPSKTADIEQSLVIGAQGARTCTLILVDAP
jgi:L-lactate dehydrogenase complex protein LldG